MKPLFSIQNMNYVWTRTDYDYLLSHSIKIFLHHKKHSHDKKKPIRSKYKTPMNTLIQLQG